MQRAEAAQLSSFGSFVSQSNCLGTQGFGALLADSAIKGMSSLVGPSAATSLLFHSALLNNIGDPRAIHQCLQSLLGSESEVVEKSIVKKLFRKLGLPFRPNGFDFERSIDLALTIHRTRAREVYLA